MSFKNILTASLVVAGLLCIAFIVRGQELSSAPPFGAKFVQCTTGSFGGLLILGGSTSGTASCTGASIVGQPCQATPSDGTGVSGIGIGASVHCAISSSGIATVSVTASVAGTANSKIYTVTAGPLP